MLIASAESGLKNCAVCYNSTAILLIDDKINVAWVKCVYCGASTKLYPTVKPALDAWNKGEVKTDE